MRLLPLIVTVLLALGFIALGLFINSGFFWGLLLFIPAVIIGVQDAFFSSNTIFRNFPIAGRFRALSEWMRPKIQQYFVESNLDGRPFNRLQREIIYARSKKGLDTNPFGTQLEVNEQGTEWMNHSIGALDPHTLNHDPRVRVGGKDCLKPYDLSVYNISAMSYGSLSAPAIESLNGGAKLGGFAHNSGEGGLSPYHKKNGGDLIYQLGTGYFGARNEEGGFSDENFVKTIADANVKMIEIKLSQGAKPGHGGILPGKKVTKEIAEIRNVPIGETVASPPYHKEFSTPVGLLQFVKRVRDLSGGIPVGFKLCVGNRSEIIAICKAMLLTGIKPDFITVDGSEGGTGAAPLEFSNHIGKPGREGLRIVYDILIGFDIKKEIQLIIGGKIVTGFDIFKAFALGADACYSARGMMMALGCIQALECNSNTCPTGIATNNPRFTRGIKVADKKQSVANFHNATVESFVELMAAAGLKHQDEINRSHVYQKISENRIASYLDIYPYLTEGSLLSVESAPDNWKRYVAQADPHSFKPRFNEVYIEED